MRATEACKAPAFMGKVKVVDVEMRAGMWEREVRNQQRGVK